jgi:hypothetical protein
LPILIVSIAASKRLNDWFQPLSTGAKPLAAIFEPGSRIPSTDWEQPHGKLGQPKTLILERSEIADLLKPHEYNDCVEHAYRTHGEDRYLQCGV